MERQPWRYYQRRRFVSLRRTTCDESDYALLVTGLPRRPGSAPVEGELRARIEEASGVAPLGVSVCWAIGDPAVLREVDARVA